jgi:hypothetical protein
MRSTLTFRGGAKPASPSQPASSAGVWIGAPELS